MMALYHGLRIVADRSMVDPVEDWSGVRSPSRARRRRKLGHPQRIVIRHVPKREAIRFGDTIVMHPELVREMERQIAQKEGSKDG